MDVVNRNITDLGGTVELISHRGQGSKFLIRLPLTLAILDGQLIRVGQQTFIVPINSIIETIQVDAVHLSSIAENDELYQYRGEYIPIIKLKNVFDVADSDECVKRRLLVIVDIGGRRFGFSVDEILGQQQVVIKSLEANYKQVPGVAGATVLGDGSVALILDVVGVCRSVAGDELRQQKVVQSEAPH